MNFERQLIHLVKGRYCLYQTKSRSNSNNHERQGEWEKVGAALRRPVSECRQRWRSLRDRFVREKKKVDLQGDSSPSLHWEYYNDLKFLGESVQERQKQKQQRSKYEDSGNFLDISNSCGVDSPIIYESFEDEYEEETPSMSASIKQNITEVEDETELPEQFDDNTPSSTKRKAYVLKTSKHESFEDDYSKPKYAKIPRRSETKPNQNPRFAEPYQTSLSEPQSTFEPPNVFVGLMNDLKTEISNIKSVEKDENDLFMECMALKMKHMSQRAKLNIQQKLLANITEELLNEL